MVKMNLFYFFLIFGQNKWFKGKEMSTFFLFFIFQENKNKLISFEETQMSSNWVLSAKKSL